MAPPICEEPLIPVAYEDCFGCGYPATCSCDDGSELTCKAMEPDCQNGTTMAIQDGCYACVDPMTCKVVDTPPPPPEPVDTCKDDADCIFTQFKTLITSTDECYCPYAEGCPALPVNKATHDARQAAFQEHCSEWYKDAKCTEPDCALPPIACENSQCVAAPDPPPSQCDTNVFCDGPVPDCAAPLIPVNKDGCWGCGHPDTCTCSNGPATCFMNPPVCDEGMEMATIDGCFQCVNPITCQPTTKPPEPAGECVADSGCTITKYKQLVATVADCFCPMCQNWPVTVAEHTARKNAWDNTCTAWEQQNPCPSPKCANPGTPACDNGTCIKIPPPDMP